MKFSSSSSSSSSSFSPALWKSALLSAQHKLSQKTVPLGSWFGRSFRDLQEEEEEGGGGGNSSNINNRISPAARSVGGNGHHWSLALRLLDTALLSGASVDKHTFTAGALACRCGMCQDRHRCTGVALLCTCECNVSTTPSSSSSTSTSSFQKQRRALDRLASASAILRYQTQQRAEQEARIHHDSSNSTSIILDKWRMMEFFRSSFSSASLEEETQQQQEESVKHEKRRRIKHQQQRHQQLEEQRTSSSSSSSASSSPTTTSITSRLSVPQDLGSLTDLLLSTNRTFDSLLVNQEFYEAEKFLSELIAFAPSSVQYVFWSNIWKFGADSSRQLELKEISLSSSSSVTSSSSLKWIPTSSLSLNQAWNSLLDRATSLEDDDENNNNHRSTKNSRSSDNLSSSSSKSLLVPQLDMFSHSRGLTLMAEKSRRSDLLLPSSLIAQVMHDHSHSNNARNILKVFFPAKSGSPPRKLIALPLVDELRFKLEFARAKQQQQSDQGENSLEDEQEQEQREELEQSAVNKKKEKKKKTLSVEPFSFAEAVNEMRKRQLFDSVSLGILTQDSSTRNHFEKFGITL